MKRTCKQCGREFELSESEISFYKGKGLELPKRCKACRDKNKGQKTPVKSSSTDTGSSSWNGGDNHSGDNHSGDNHNRNDKSHLVIAGAAVLLILAVFLIKHVFALPYDDAPIGGDIVSAEIPSKQETINETLAEALSNVPSKEQQFAQQAVKDEEQPTGQRIWQQETQKEEQPETVQTQQDAQNETEPEVKTETAAVIILETVQEVSSTAYSFRKAQYLTEHFQKHGAEFPYATEEEYLRGANNVIQNPNALHKLEAEDGDDVYYVESTKEFVVVSTDGYIRTYFKADLDYYNRQ